MVGIEINLIEMIARIVWFIAITKTLKISPLELVVRIQINLVEVNTE